MPRARSFVLSAICLCACTLVALRPSAAPAQTINFSLNVLYLTPTNTDSGGIWELVAKSSNFGIAGVDVHLNQIATAALTAPRATVNGNDPAGFNLFVDATFPTLIIGQTPIELTASEEQGAFYGVGQLANGAPNYPGKPPGSNSEGPAFTTLTAPLGIPWATGDIFGDAAWSTAARLASGTFATGVTPSFLEGTSGNVFTTLGSSTTFGDTALASIITAIVRTNYAPSADYNRNGIVDAADYVLWRNQQGQTVPNGTGADGTGDGIVNQADYVLWRSRFGQPFGAGSGGSVSTSAVPEPTSFILFFFGGAHMLLAFRRRQRFQSSSLIRDSSAH